MPLSIIYCVSFIAMALMSGSIGSIMLALSAQTNLTTQELALALPFRYVFGSIGSIGGAFMLEKTASYGNYFMAFSLIMLAG